MRQRVVLGAASAIVASTLTWFSLVPQHRSDATVALPQTPHLQDVANGDPDELLAFGRMKAPRWLVQTVLRAAQATEVDPAYLMALADVEASLVPDREARTSSAEGLFQFVDGTWLEVVRRYGGKHGLGAEAEAIAVADGRCAVSDAEMRERILRLRRDPYIAALMAGEMISTHREILAGHVARDPTFSELYMAHLLGIQGAKRFVALLGEEPHKSAPKAFPRAARHNGPLFYGRSDTGGRTALSLAELQERLDLLIDERVARYAELRGQAIAPAARSNEQQSVAGAGAAVPAI